MFTLLVVCATFVCFSTALPVDEKQVDILMPNVKPQVADTYLCTSLKLTEPHLYIDGFIPNADHHIAHHVLLYGCAEPGSTEDAWNCGEMQSKTPLKSSYEIAPKCAVGQPKIIYAWAMDAPKLMLPPGVAFEVGADTDIKYLVLQVHYKNVTKFKPPINGIDMSGLTLKTSKKPSSKQAGVYLMVTDGQIPSHSIEYFETACKFTDNIVLHPFAYRVHAHTLGRVNSGYRVRDGVWTEIGRKDPRLPEMFYNTTTNDITIENGDILAARCTMENTEDHTVRIGSTQKDEMCNFYIMYYTEIGEKPSEDTCSSDGPPDTYWSSYKGNGWNPDQSPSDASTIPGESKPFVRNASYPDLNQEPFDSGNSVPGMPGRFMDVEDMIQRANEEQLMRIYEEIAAEKMPNSIY